MRRFKIGDEIRCARGASGLGLVEGEIYIVDGYVLGSDCLLHLLGCSSPVDQQRFESTENKRNIEPFASEPRIIKSEQLRVWDIDDTLVLTTMETDADFPTVEVPDLIEGGTIKLKVHQPMVRLLKEEHARGSYNIVWSRSGYQWAVDVLTAIGVLDKVHMVMSKPMVYFDDSPVENWMKDRVYIQPTKLYKK